MLTSILLTSIVLTSISQVAVLSAGQAGLQQTVASLTDLVHQLRTRQREQSSDGSRGSIGGTPDNELIVSQLG